MGWTHSFIWDTWQLVKTHPLSVVFFLASFVAWGYLIRVAMNARDKEDA